MMWSLLKRTMTTKSDDIISNNNDKTDEIVKTALILLDEEIVKREKECITTGKCRTHIFFDPILDKNRVREVEKRLSEARKSKIENCCLEGYFNTSSVEFYRGPFGVFSFDIKLENYDGK